MMTPGWWTRPLSSADEAARPSSAPTWPDGPKCGYSPAHSRMLSGDLGLHLIATASGLPITWALAPAKADERDIALEMLRRSGLARAGQTIIADKGYRRKSFEKTLNQSGYHSDPTGHQNRATPTRAKVPPPLPPDHRVGQQHPQNPTRPRTAPGTHQTRGHSTRPATSPRPHRRDLAQPNHQPTRTSPLPHRIRPLTPWN